MITAKEKSIRHVRRVRASNPRGRVAQFLIDRATLKSTRRKIAKRYHGVVSRRAGRVASALRRVSEKTQDFADKATARALNPIKSGAYYIQFRRGQQWITHAICSGGETQTNAEAKASAIAYAKKFARRFPHVKVRVFQ